MHTTEITILTSGRITNIEYISLSSQSFLSTILGINIPPSRQIIRGMIYHIPLEDFSI